MVLLCYILIFNLYAKHRPDNTRYPEGEQLIKKWREQDREEAKRILAERFPSDIKPSLLDDDTDISIPQIDSGFSGGFSVSSDIYDDNDEDN